MAIKSSTGLRTAMLDTADFVSAIPNRVLLLYTGAIPATADAAQTGAPICIISDNSTGDPLLFEEAAGGAMVKDSSQVWSGLVAGGGGTVTHWRMVSGTDTGALSTTEPRIQGTAGTDGGNDLIMSSAVLTGGATHTIDSGTVSQGTF